MRHARQTVRRHVARLSAAAAVVLPANLAFSADVTRTWKGGVGDWATNTMWVAVGVPNNTSSTTYAVIIDGQSGTASAVTVGSTGSYTIDTLRVDADDRLLVNGNLTTTQLSASGLISVNTGGKFTVSSLLDLASTGMIRADGGVVVVNADHTVGPAGQRFAVANGGTLRFKSLNTNGVAITVGNGTLSAATLTNATASVNVGSGGTLTVTNAYTLSHANELVLSPGGTLSFGPLNLAGRGYAVPAGASLKAQALDNTGGTFDVLGTTAVASLVNNSGTINVIGTGSATFTTGVTGGVISVDSTASCVIQSQNGAFGPATTLGNFTLARGTLSLVNQTYYGARIAPGTITNNGTINFGDKINVGSGVVTLAGSGVYNVTRDWETSSLIPPASAVVVNNATLRASTANFLYANGPYTHVVNNGTLEAFAPTAGSASPGFAFGGLSMTNGDTGRLLVRSGGLLFCRSLDFTSTGQIAIESGGLLHLSSSSNGTYAARSIDCDGNLLLSSVKMTADRISGTGAMTTQLVGKLRIGQVATNAFTVNGGSMVTLGAQPVGGGIVAQRVGTLSISASQLELAAAASPADRMVLIADSLTLLPPGGYNGAIDLNNNDMIVRNGSLPAITGELAKGYKAGWASNGTNWNAIKGILSTAVAQNQSAKMAIGVMLNRVDGGQGTGEPIYTLFDGQPVTATDVLVRYTYSGDADLDGGVSINDFNKLTTHFGKATGQGWVDGDFDYDGGVSINDFNLLAMNFGKSLEGGVRPDFASLLAFAAAHDDLTEFEAATGVPEPATIGLVVAGLALATRRRG